MVHAVFNIAENVTKVFFPILTREILYSSLLFFVILPISFLLRKKSVYWQLGLWSLVLLRLVLPPDFSQPLSLRNIIEPHLQETRLRMLPELIPEVETFAQGGHSLDDGWDAAAAGNKIPLRMILLGCWLLGVLVTAAIYIKRFLFYIRIVKRSRTVNNERIEEVLDQWRARLGITRRVVLLTSQDLLSPFCIGLFRPKVFLPARLLEIGDSDMIESIIAHELAHIKRNDDFWIKLQSALQILYFFHPVVWIANSRIHLARECICDALVLSKNKLSIDTYGKSLLAVLKINLFGSESAGLLPRFGSPRDKFKRRIEVLKGEHVMKKYKFIVMSGVMLLLGFLLLPMASGPLQSQVKKVVVKPVFVKPVIAKPVVVNIELDSTVQL